jgi:hypothetical protein
MRLQAAIWPAFSGRWADVVDGMDEMDHMDFMDG